MKITYHWTNQQTVLGRGIRRIVRLVISLNELGERDLRVEWEGEDLVKSVHKRRNTHHRRV